MWPPLHDDQAVGQLHDLVEVGRDEQHRNAASASSSTSFLRMNSVAPTSMPRVGWSARMSTGSFGELTRNDDLLDIAAGEHADLLLSRLAQDRVVLNEPVGLFVDGLHVEERPVVQPFFRRSGRR